MSLNSTFIVVDDHPVYRHGVVALVMQELHLESVGEAATIGEATELLIKGKPDLAIIDISLQGQSGLDLVRIIKNEYPKTAVLVVSMHDESLYGERALKAGARGYVMKHSDPARLLEAVRSVLEGRIVVSDELRDRMMGAMIGGGPSGDTVSNLSDRELEVFRLIGKGFGAAEIAEALRISVKTVNAYREHIKDKIHIETAADLRKYAVEWMSTNPL